MLELVNKMFTCNFLLLLCLSLASTGTCKTSLHVAVFLPDYEPTDSLAYQSQVLLSSGLQAIGEVNNCSDVLDSFSLKLIPILTVESDIFSAVIEFYDLLLSPEVRLVGIVGQMDRMLAQLLTPITDRVGITQLINLVSDTNESRYPNLFTPVPSLTLHVEAAVYLIVSQQWARVGLLHTDSPAHLGAAQGFISLVKQLHAVVEVVPILVSPDSLNDTVDLLEDSQSFIFLSLLPFSLSDRVISSAQQRDFTYTWILLQYESNDEPMIKSNNTLILRYLHNATNVSPVPVACASNVVDTRDFVYRSLWALSVALNNSATVLNSSFPGIVSVPVGSELDASPFVQRYTYGDQIVDILWNGNQTIGYFNSQTKTISVNVNITVPGLEGNISHVYVTFSPELTRFTVALVGVCYLLTTLLLVLFVCFRREPEIKASSFSLSLLMFLGCYFILSGALTLFVTNGTVLLSHVSRVSRCNVELFFVAVGMDIILTSLLVKLVRVWRIFTVHGRSSRLWKDYFLFGFVAAVIGVKLALLFIWVLVDPYSLEDVVHLLNQDNNSVVYETVQQCQSRYYLVWLGFIYGYSIIIALILIIVSVLTRKIRQENFKDTKKVAIYTTSCAIVAIECGSLWTLLRLSNNSIGSKLSFGFMYCALVLLSELFLFLPKILPPILRRLNLAHAYENKEIKFSSIRSPTIRPLSNFFR